MASMGNGGNALRNDQKRRFGGRKESLINNIYLVGLFKCRPKTEAIFQKYPPENFQRPPRCIGGAVLEGSPYTLFVRLEPYNWFQSQEFSSKMTKRNAL